MKRGYDRVGVIHGGFDEWVRLGLPTQPRSEEALLRVPGSAPGDASAQNSSA
jgi:3-mercaptopyruvate sulfurtransferase SseA